MNRDNKPNRLSYFGKTLLLGMCASVFTGCATFWDDMTSVSPEGGFGNNVAHRFGLLFHRPDPMKVLRDSRDADQRARAFRSLSEPRASGGSAEEQEFTLNLLATASKEEPQVVARLAALETLAEFRDPRASVGLIEALNHTRNATDRSVVVRIAAVNGLKGRNDPGAVEAVAQVLQNDASREVRLAAAESMGGFDNYQATQALVRVLKEQKDVAMQDQAASSLRQITGRDLPAEAVAWEQFLETGTTQRPGFARRRPDSPIQQVVNWMQGR